MKKLFSLSLLCLGIMGGARAQTCSTTVTTYPYTENFDGATAPGWTSGGTNSSWWLGTPAKTIINSAASGTKAWVTNMTGQYNLSEKSYVESPCFNMSTLIQPVIEMKIWWNIQFSYDGAVLQSSIDNGVTWQNVGAKGDPYNWYNDNTINAGPGNQTAATAEGWTGTTATNNGSGGWVTARHVLTGLQGKPNVKLRIAFASDTYLNDEGFAFDNFSIYESPANDAGITSITSPGTPVTPLISQPIAVTLKNYGISPLTSATMCFSVNGVTQPAFAWAGNLAMNTTSAPVTIGNYAFPAGAYTIKTWSKSPNGAIDGNPANDTTSITIKSCNSLSGNYTIDKGAVASTTNFTSFSAAAIVLGDCGVSGPVTFTVAPNSGPYNELITLTNIPGASATNTITFNGNGNTISNPVTTNDFVVKLDGAKFIRINNLKILPYTATTPNFAVVLSNNANSNILSGCTITHSITSNGTFYGINIITGSSNNTFQNNTVIGGYYGIYNNGLAANLLTSNKFIGNTVRDQASYCIYTTHSTNVLIEGNDFSRPNRVNGSDFYGIFLNTGTSSATVNKNRIHNTHDAASSTTGAAYGVYNTAAATAGNENIITNNIIYNLTNNGGGVQAFYNTGSGNYYYHNTVSIDNPAFSYGTLRGIYFAAAPNNAKFINNIISLSSTATNKHAIYLQAIPVSLASDNNELYIGSTGNIGFLGTDKATLADWKTTTYDQTSIAVDPVFANWSTNLQPLAAAVNNTGQALAAVTTDISGASRSTTTPDAGAYEFTPAANEAGVTAILSPTSPVTPGVSQPVQVTLKNFGTATLATATIGWSINNIAQANFTWTGSLTSMQSSAPISIGNYTFPAGNFTIKVWSKLPNGAVDGVAANDTTILRINSCAALAAGNYTINKALPASATNFPSIADATQRLTTCGVSGPVTFTVVSGTGPYNEQVEIKNIPFASATNTVTFEGSGNTVSTTPGARPGIIILNGAKYVKLNNFVITLDAAATSGWGVQLMNAADFNTISNNTINLPILASNPASSSTNVNGIFAGTGIFNFGNNTNNTRILNNTINGGNAGIQIMGVGGASSTANNNQIVGNQIRDSYGEGIYVNSVNGTLIEGNDISRPTRTKSATSFFGIHLVGGSNTIVSKNRIHNTHDLVAVAAGNTLFYGVYNSSPALLGSENIIKNNAIYNINYTGTTNFKTYGLYNFGGSNAYYYHNTVATDPAINYNVLSGAYFQSALPTTPLTNVKFINNIISIPGTATTKHAIYLTYANFSPESNNNVLYIGTTGNIGYYAADKPTLADWRAANTIAPFDQNSVAIDPVFVNASTGNLKPTSVGIDNLGQPLAAVTDDILGAARTATPDPGAYEFGVPGNDVGIIAVSGPSSTVCGLSASETITITIKNYGLNTQTAVPVSFAVDGVPMAATPETYTGSIAPNATATYTFTAKANLATAGSYVITAKTQLAGDLATNNDADTLNITNWVITTLPLAYDFETPATGFTRFRKVTNPKSNITEDAGASNGIVSTKGMIMDGVTNANWSSPTGVTDPWTNNTNNFSGAYFCISPAGAAANDTLWLTFDLKQLWKTGNPNTNFRVTVNGTAVGGNQGSSPANTYRPPFNGIGGTTNWTRVKIDLSAYLTQPNIQIGLESSVSESYANGTGTANLIDNIGLVRIAGPTAPSGVKDNSLQGKVAVYPNPSNGLFQITLPQGKAYELTVTDLTGKVLQKQAASAGTSQLNLTGTAKGIYLLRVSGENGSAVRKLIVE